jgi:UDPglucose--hexose-1-phosphate uridylyltransferase
MESPLYEQAAQILSDTLKKMNRVLNDPPYNYVIHTSSFSGLESEHYHWHLEIMPKLTKVAGFEWGTGFYINPTPPEEAAEYLREVK